MFSWSWKNQKESQLWWSSSWINQNILGGKIEASELKPLSNKSLRFPCLKGESRSETNWGPKQKELQMHFCPMHNGRTLQSTHHSDPFWPKIRWILPFGRKQKDPAAIWKIDFGIEIKLFSRNVSRSDVHNIFLKNVSSKNLLHMNFSTWCM